MIYRVTFRGADGLPHGAELVAENDSAAVKECKKFYSTTDWVLRRRDGRSAAIIAESVPKEAASE